MNTRDESPAQLTQKGSREDGLGDLGTKGADAHCPETLQKGVCLLASERQVN